jgi:hypothetical protein
MEMILKLCCTNISTTSSFYCNRHHLLVWPLIRISCTVAGRPVHPFRQQTLPMLYRKVGHYVTVMLLADQALIKARDEGRTRLRCAWTLPTWIVTQRHLPTAAPRPRPPSTRSTSLVATPLPQPLIHTPRTNRTITFRTMGQGPIQVLIRTCIPTRRGNYPHSLVRHNCDPPHRRQHPRVDHLIRLPRDK